MVTAESGEEQLAPRGSQWNHKRVYAKGYFDGIRAARGNEREQNNQAENMNETRFKSLVEGLPSTSSKVLALMPAHDAEYGMTISEAASSIRRVHGSNVGLQAIESAVRKMAEAGLLTASSDGTFRKVRVHTRSQPKLQDAEIEVAPVTTEPAATPALKVEFAAPSNAEDRALDSIASLSKRLRYACEQLSAIADELDSVAIGIAEQLSSRSEAARQLDMVRDILRSAA